MGYPEHPGPCSVSLHSCYYYRLWILSRRSQPLLRSSCWEGKMKTLFWTYITAANTTHHRVQYAIIFFTIWHKQLPGGDQLTAQPSLHPGHNTSSLMRQLQSQSLIFGPKWSPPAKWTHLRVRQSGTADFVFMQISGTVWSLLQIPAWQFVSISASSDHV